VKTTYNLYEDSLTFFLSFVINAYTTIYRLPEGVGMSLRFNALHRAFNSNVKKLLDAVSLCHAQRKYVISQFCHQEPLEIHVVETQQSVSQCA
jgi:hypothetical protein